MRKYSALIFMLLTCLSVQAVEPIDTSGFLDAIAHWQKKFGRDRNDPRFSPDQIESIADNLLLYQNPNGGWPKDIDWLARIPKDEVVRLRGASLEKSTLDNRTTYTHVAYLAEAYQKTGLERFRTGAERGLDYILAEQRPSGGWRGADVDAITFNDDIMVGVMRLLVAVSKPTPIFAWLDADRRAQSQGALAKALQATLACQIVVNGQKTAWCQQHDHATFLPVKARKYELPSICAAESSSIVRFLMDLDAPSPDIVEAIHAAMAWFDSAAIAGLRLETVPIEPVRFENHTATRDVRVVEDPNAPLIWARYYELDTNRPFFCRGDGTVVYSLDEVDLERRTGYGWYGQWPAPLRDTFYPAWKARVNSMNREPGRK